MSESFSFSEKDFSFFPKQPLKTKHSKNKTFTNPEDKFLNILETAAWREDIQHAAVTLSADEKKRHDFFGWNSKKPSNSQLGALRAVLARMQTEADKAKLQDWLAHLQATDNRKDKWEKEGLDFIKYLLDDPNFIWEKLAINVNNKNDLKTELWAEAVRTLFAVAMHYEQRERES